MNISIRPLADADLKAADTILTSAFRSSASRLRDLELYRRMQPDGWFLASRHEQPIGMVGTTNYGVFAYVGLMAVRPDAQRQGVALALMRFLLTELDRQRIPLILLDASEAGHRLYNKLGFVAYDETLVFERHGHLAMPERPSQIELLSVRELDELVQWDKTVFGANRHKVFQVLLDVFPGRAFMLRDEQGKIMGYLFAQRGRIGPWVVLEPGNAEALLQAALTLPYEETVSVVVPGVNKKGIELLQRYGFGRVRTNRQMGRGAGEPPGQRRKIYAQTSLAVG